MSETKFDSAYDALTYAAANDLNLVWEGTAAFEKRRRNLPPDQFDVRSCITRKGITNCGLFPKSIERAEWEADEPRQARLAAKRAKSHARNFVKWA
jgi:hypothetical protein